MKMKMIAATLCGLASSSAASAQERGLTWEGEVEIGVDSTISADDPKAELTDTYVSASVAFEAAITDRLSAFGGLTLESVLDAEESRTFDDLGLYVSELGLRYTFGDIAVSVGKISPTFAVAWDETPGFYGTALAGDYELAEMIGATVEAPAGPGTVSFAAFYVDETGLSDSIGTKRGRVSVADGGVGNTGKLDNFALQYTLEFGETTAWVGARHLTAGETDASDETGIVAGMSHDLGDGLSAIAELAHFNGAGGTDEDALYATLGGAYALGDWTYSAAATLVDHSADGQDRMITVGVDRTLAENLDISFGLARFDVGGEKSTAVGLSAIYAF
ncbi:hypothetical protein Z946_3544 [Sulfitobacter noctilucicola]|uniref:Porin domain-containing protein n=1 Tax=Sulfitobacter noctilucicola TaxID=1342301 RepID=A0A7W6M843_9RHOB|nr:porin [Sulfitobacter noctilucicola]KIN64652.1 hypothetical protein Z946_3544 [Sulfitobacter noctilucicola]MBB4174199.1 hypothetical protein [Sulfitobacter noctilucicola]